MRDPRTQRGLRKLNVWITADLSDRLDAARDGRPVQKFVPRLLYEALTMYGRSRRIAHELPPNAEDFSVEVRSDGKVVVLIRSSQSGEQTTHVYEV